jgi:hypothetical protein
VKNKNELIEDKIYNKLKTTLLEVGYLNNNLIIAAKFLKKVDTKYMDKIEVITNYLFQKIKEGDGIAYALIYVAQEDKLSKLNELHNFDKISDYLLEHTDLQSTNDNEFFDPKVVYFAEILGTGAENEG